MNDLFQLIQTQGHHAQMAISIMMVSVGHVLLATTNWGTIPDPVLNVHLALPQEGPEPGMKVSV